ncbi:MAG: efflux RND transporter periplasmic adaptor subunit [Alphaproteobacteria bacterium]|nr:efflux RND transporter periplasmic adaptor subunit [Alphaproteobacteria bacterium]
MMRLGIFAIGGALGIAVATLMSPFVANIRPPTDEADVKHAQAKPGEARDRSVLYYRNPMGLADVSPVPKKDSMGMDYIPVYADDAPDPANVVRVGVDKVQRAGVRTEPAVRRMLASIVRATGTTVANERNLAVVTLKFAGFVESLAVQETGAEIRAGEPLMRIWLDKSEAYQRQVDYLLALRGAPPLDGGRQGIEPAERNLRLLDFPQSAIEQLRKTGEPMRSIPWVAPFGGTVLEKPAVVGMRFEPGTPLFRLANLSSVWVMADVAERDLATVQPGQRALVALRAMPGQPVEGKVDFVYPDINMATRTGRLRIELRNPDRRIKLGAFADVTVEAEAARGAVVTIPESAVIDNGMRRVAFVAMGDGRFEPRKLVLGGRGGGYVEVRDGVAEGETVVTRGNFLIDAESNLRAALAGFAAPAEDRR